MKTRLLLAAAGLLAPVAALALTFPVFPSADLVLGQPNFTSSGFLNPASPRTLNAPICVAFDPATGKVFVADTNSNRVLRYANFASLANQAGAEAVLGAVNFSGTVSALGQTSMDSPAQICVDALGRLWVADSGNNRVLMFHNAATRSTGAAADLVLGQPDFITNTPLASAAKMSSPTGVWLGANDTLWVADFNNQRVLRFDNVSQKVNGSAADGVLGQALFTTNSAGTSATTMTFPAAVYEDGAGRLWVAETANARVLRFDDARELANGAAADGVLGQPDFNTADSVVSASSFFFGVGGVTGDTDGNLYVTDCGSNRVLIFRNAAAKADGAEADAVIGQPDFTTGTSGTTAQKFTMSFGCPAIDPAGALWVADRLNDRVLRFSPVTTPPTLAFTGKVPKQTKKAQLTLRGTASSEAGVASVEVRVGREAFRAATGTTSWRFKAKLAKGRNRIQVRATDAEGRTSTLRAAVKRK